LTASQWKRLVANGHAVNRDPSHDARPVVKLARPDGFIRLLIAEVKPEAPDLAFGLMDWGTKPMLRFISLRELAAAEIGADLQAQPYSSDLTLIEAALAAEEEGRIIDYAAEPCP
jgi:hypothetical protein